LAEQYGYDYFHGKYGGYPKSGYETQPRIKKNFCNCIQFALSIIGNKNIRWLDVGCAYGFLVSEAERLGLDAYGVDISDYAILEARKLFPHLRERFVVCNCNELLAIFFQNSFAVISMLDVVEHLENPRNSLIIMGKLLKSRGLLLITTSSPKHQRSGMDKDPTHINVRSIKYWKKTLKELGFKVKYPCLLYDPREVGSTVVRIATRNRLLRKIYSTIRAYWLTITNPYYYEILAVKI